MDNPYHSQYKEAEKPTKFVCLDRTVTDFPLNK